MVEMGRAPFSDITFEAEVGPIIVDNLISARWKSHAIYHGGIPGAKAATGTALVYHGMDIMRIEHGKIAEYWVSADVYHLMAQLGAVS